ncbi:DUF294 nucleotidyltransferase-like domain-containing protein [Desulfitibacter alkalitolerans]|uniref:DUF294 nucleotidyltransferase-like domain-containing protein n=1 Tax=Desulfitibacter alkalitolerans TaxID=264641 RepID=UPI0004846733|nr:DUF294 nucleotidyltransferase-like domain-containing protein [Desulfitibacter alkalitolerans]
MECISFLQNTRPFISLPKVTLIQICSRLELKKYPQHSFIFKKGEPSHNTLYIVFKGLAEVIVSMENQDIGVSYRKPGDFFGETVFLSGNTYPASVKAVEDLHCFSLDKETFEDLCVKHPCFAKHFSHILSERMRSVYQELVMNQTYEVSGLETNLFRHSLKEMMSTPVATCYENEKVQKIAETMKNKNISSIVVLDNDDRYLGIISEKDLVGKCLTACMPPASWPTAKEVMDAHPIELSPEASFHQGLLAMTKNKCKHVLITENDELKGIVSMGDMVRFRSMGAFSIIDEIESQNSLEGLRALKPQVDNVLKALVSEKAPPVEICELITEYKDRITRKIIELCEQEMFKEGLGYPPADYCWLTLGSGGRKEQLLTMDQNNAVIFDNISSEKNGFVKDYFLRLAGKVVQGIEKSGNAKFKGDIAAHDARWCNSLDGWEQIVNKWAHDLNSGEVTLITNFLDFRPVYGRKKLADKLKMLAMSALSKPEMLQLMLQEEVNSEIPTKLFKRVLISQDVHNTHDFEINLRTQACMHVVRCIRILSLKEGIAETSTLKRLQQLMKKGVLPREDAEYIEAAYQSLVVFRLKSNLDKLKEGKEPDDLIRTSRLSKMQYLALKEALIAVSQLQSFTKSVF